MLTSATALASFPLPRVTLDCSSLSGEEQYTGTAANQVLEWVRALPHGSPVHIFLRTSIRDSGARQLKNRLQALGCTVTAKIA